MIIEATDADKPALSTYLARHFTTTMFMRGNLRAFGMGNTTSNYGMRYFIRYNGAQITGVGALANIGTIMLQADENRAEIVAHIAGTLPKGFKPHAITGAPEQVNALVNGLGFAGLPTKMNDIEPLFVLNSTALIQPEMDGFVLRPSNMDDLPLLSAWNFAYDKEVLGQPDTGEMRQEAYEETVNTIKRGHQRVLEKNGEIVAQTNLNAVMPDAVQLGGVFTPPCWRNHGYARRAVAAHMAEAFASGVENAILFSASESASKAYRAVGFRHIGAYQIILFE